MSLDLHHQRQGAVEGGKYRSKGKGARSTWQVARGNEQVARDQSKLQGVRSKLPVTERKGKWYGNEQVAKVKNK
jgi:hypothetical protein